MKRFNPEKFINNKYNHLLMIEIFILVAFPFLQSIDARFPVTSLMLLVAITPALWVGLSNKVFFSVISIGLLAYVLNLVTYFSIQELRHEGRLVLLFLYAVFLFLAITILIKNISSYKVVTADTIKGGISIYVLLGLFWAVLYMIVLIYDPDALANVHEAGFDCYYYSFTTLTTLGYGDITPVANYAKILAMMEAIVGPVYLAIFVAQLIGLNIARKLKG